MRLVDDGSEYYQGDNRSRFATAMLYCWGNMEPRGVCHHMDDERSSHSLDDFSRRLYQVLNTAASLRTNETELRGDAEPVIQEALDKLYGMSALSFTAERKSRRGGRREYDKLYGGVVVEWEWGGESRRAGGAKQALEYLADVRADLEEEDAFTAVVCDGKKWGFLAIDPGGSQLGLFEADLKPKDRFEWHDNSPSACRRFLELVASHRKSPITASRLAEAFGPSAAAARQVVGLLAEALAGRSKDDRSDTLYREWRRSLDVAYGDLDAVGGELAFTIRDEYDVGGFCISPRNGVLVSGGYAKTPLFLDESQFRLMSTNGPSRCFPVRS